MEALGEGGARLLQGVPSFSTLFIEEENAGPNHPPLPHPPPPKSLLSHQYINSFFILFTLNVHCQKKLVEVKEIHILRCLFSMLFFHSGYYGPDTWVFHRQVETRSLHADVEIGGLANAYKLSQEAVWNWRVGLLAGNRCL